MGEGSSEDPPSPSLPFRQPPGSIRSAPDQGGPQRRRQRGVSPAAAQPRVEAGFASQRSGEAERPGSGTSARGLGRRPGNVAGGFRVLMGARGGRPGAGSGAAGLARPPGQQRFGGWGGGAGGPVARLEAVPGGSPAPRGSLDPGRSPDPEGSRAAPHGRPGRGLRTRAVPDGAPLPAAAAATKQEGDRERAERKGESQGKQSTDSNPSAPSSVGALGSGLFLIPRYFFLPRERLPQGRAPPGATLPLAFAAPSFPPAPRELCFVGS